MPNTTAIQLSTFPSEVMRFIALDIDRLVDRLASGLVTSGCSKLAEQIRLMLTVVNEVLGNRRSIRHRVVGEKDCERWVEVRNLDGVSCGTYEITSAIITEPYTSLDGLAVAEKELENDLTVKCEIGLVKTKAIADGVLPSDAMFELSRLGLLLRTTLGMPLAPSGTDPHAPYMHVGWFQDEFGMTHYQLRGHARRGNIRVRKQGHWNLYSVPDARKIWPELVTHGPPETG